MLTPAALPRRVSQEFAVTELHWYERIQRNGARRKRESRVSDALELTSVNWTRRDKGEEKQ